MKKVIAWVILGIGAWLVFWNPIDFITQGIDHSIWDISIVTGGWLSIVIGVIIIYVMARHFRQVLF